MNDRERKPRARWAWLESRRMAPGEAARRLDRARREFLGVGALFAATRVSIVLVVLLARAGRQDRIQTVIDDLRRAVRKAQRNREIVFALYHVTNAAARGADLHEAAAEALARLRRCRDHRLATSMEPNPSSGANDGAGDSERRSRMETQQDVQELKPERVQEELAAAELYRVSLKAERVQGPELAAAGAEVPVSPAMPMTSAFELTINQKQPVTIELPALQVVITLHTATADNSAIDAAVTGKQ